MRLQILELPSKVRGDDVETPFVIVVSEAGAFGPGPSDEIMAEFQRLKVGARAMHVLVTNDVVEIGPAA